MTKELISKLRELSDRVFHGDTKPGDFRIIDRAADALAAVPDAATGNVQKMYDRACADIQEYSETIKRLEAEVDDWREGWIIARLTKAEAERDAANEYAFFARQTLAEVEEERDAALAAVERVRAVHRKFTYYELEDSCPDTSEDHREERHQESDEIGEFYCEDMPTGDVACDLCRDTDGERLDWPCLTVAALYGAPEPEAVEHDYAIKYTSSDEHFRKVGSLEDARELADSTLGDVIMHRIKSRQVPAGPWLPVEGESK